MSISLLKPSIDSFTTFLKFSVSILLPVSPALTTYELPSYSGCAFTGSTCWSACIHSRPLIRVSSWFSSYVTPTDAVIVCVFPRQTGHRNAFCSFTSFCSSSPALYAREISVPAIFSSVPSDSFIVRTYPSTWLFMYDSTAETDFPEKFTPLIFVLK